MGLVPHSITPTLNRLGRPRRVGTPGGTGRTSKIPNTHGPWDGGTGPDPQGPPSLLPAERAGACPAKSGPEQSFPPFRLAVFVPIGVSRNAGWLRPIPHSNSNKAFRICVYPCPSVVKQFCPSATSRLA